MKSLKEIVEQLRDCGFTCEAGPLQNNVDFRLLAELADVELPKSMSEAFADVGKFAKAMGLALAEAMRSPQQKRDDIIEKAKRDVAELSEKVKNAAFNINREKRTVVAYSKRKNYPIFARPYGIAKADPSDCFNVHIGKAIALRRALGLEVPAEYYNAPQPTEVRVGDVIQSAIERYDDTPYTVGRLEDGRAYEVNELGWIPTDYVKIIDDSREDVAE